MLLRIDFFILCLLAWTAIKQREEKWKKALFKCQSGHYKSTYWLVSTLFHQSFFFLRHCRGIAISYWKSPTLISTEITHQRLLPLNWRPDSECIWFSLSFLDYNTRLQIKPYMLQWHIILCLNVWGLFTLVPIQLNFSVLCNLCNRLKIWSHMIV